MMYRDDPLDDEFELRELLGDDVVDTLAERDSTAERTPVEAAVDVLRVLQGWVSDATAARWFLSGQQRLGGERPVDLLRRGVYEDVEEAARIWAAAQG
jgi:hypothetical protein